MYAKTTGLALYGLHGLLVQVEVDLANGLPSIDLVGLPDSSVREAKDRVRAAMRNSGFEFPLRRITVNLAPAHLRKEGSGFDLCMALGILLADGKLEQQAFYSTGAVGELALDGTVRPVRGMLSLAMAAREHGLLRLLVAKENAAEASFVRGIEILAVHTLQEAYQFLKGDLQIAPEALTTVPEKGMADVATEVDFAEIKGQQNGKRALEIAASGMHNCLLLGPPGSGKTMLAKRLPTILPPLTERESLEVTQIYSVAGQLAESGLLLQERPFRAPHHTISAGGLIGGGRIPRPGEVSLAHRGVLFLDELPEFGKSVLEVLRQPLEDAQVTLSRVQASYTFPSRFVLIAAMNPCPCGFFGSDFKACTCTPLQVNRYRSKISGPLLDRIDLHIEIPRIHYQDIVSETVEESSAEIRERILYARHIQESRFKDRIFPYNSAMTPRDTRKYCPLSPEAKELLNDAFEHLGLSARAYERILKVARTLADLAGQEMLDVAQVAEAVQYRGLDRKYFGQG